MSLRFVSRWLLPALGLAILAAACGGGGDGSPVDTPGNLLANPGFEEGRDPWFSLRPPQFLLTDELANSGGHSAHLPLRGEPNEDGHKIIYLVQELAADEFPEVISGYYRVENWNKGTPLQYIQFVIVVFDAQGIPGEEFLNHQIRYVLGGIDRAPFGIRNGKFVFLGGEEVTEGEWIYFERNLRQDFEELWGAVPGPFGTIRLLYEVRYDDKQMGEGPLHADVYYDDLYLGPAPDS